MSQPVESLPDMLTSSQAEEIVLRETAGLRATVLALQTQLEELKKSAGTGTTCSKLSQCWLLLKTTKTPYRAGQNTCTDLTNHLTPVLRELYRIFFLKKIK